MSEQKGKSITRKEITYKPCTRKYLELWNNYKRVTNLVIIVRKLHEMRLHSFKEVWRGHKMKSMVSIFHSTNMVPSLILDWRRNDITIIKVRNTE